MTKRYAAIPEAMRQDSFRHQKARWQPVRTGDSRTASGSMLRRKETAAVPPLLPGSQFSAAPHIVGYLPALYPDSASYRLLLQTARSAGLHYMEIGIPADDAHLDGAIIKQALEQVAHHHRDLPALASASVEIARAAGICGILMLYHETLTSFGIERFVKLCIETRTAAVLVPNITRGDRHRLHALLAGTPVRVVNFIHYGASHDEIIDIVQHTTGFVYVQSMQGVTGGSFIADDPIADRLALVKELARNHGLPVALGFGISTPADVRAASALDPDAVIVGTACVSAADRGTEAFRTYLRTITAASKETTRWNI